MLSPGKNRIGVTKCDRMHPAHTGFHPILTHLIFFSTFVPVSFKSVNHSSVPRLYFRDFDDPSPYEARSQLKG
nr:expressed protein [Hymenolepis microstoma]